MALPSAFFYSQPEEFFSKRLTPVTLEEGEVEPQEQEAYDLKLGSDWLGRVV